MFASIKKNYLDSPRDSRFIEIYVSVSCILNTITCALIYVFLPQTNLLPTYSALTSLMFLPIFLFYKKKIRIANITSMIFTSLLSLIALFSLDNLYLLSLGVLTFTIFGAVYLNTQLKIGKRSLDLFFISSSIIATISASMFLGLIDVFKLDPESCMLIFLTNIVSLIFSTLLSIYVEIHLERVENKKLLASYNLLEIIILALTHDLANPLQNALFLTDLSIQAGSITTERLNKISGSLLQMSAILKTLRCLAATSKNGKISLDMHYYSIHDLINESIYKSNLLSQEKRIKITYQSKFANDVKIKVDRDVFVHQILNNFISNAIKFSEPSSEVLVTCDYLPAQEVIKIVIRDWGSGIEKNKIDKLFGLSDHTSTQGTIGETGLGLGVPIAHRFLTFMEASLTLNSHPAGQFDKANQGTEVEITIPAVVYSMAYEVSA